MPSAGAARAFLKGEPGGFERVVLTSLGRAVLVTPALYLTGVKRPVVSALAVAASIELFVLTLFAWKMRESNDTPGLSGILAAQRRIPS